MFKLVIQALFLWNSEKRIRIPVILQHVIFSIPFSKPTIRKRWKFQAVQPVLKTWRSLRCSTARNASGIPVCCRGWVLPSWIHGQFPSWVWTPKWMGIPCGITDERVWNDKWVSEWNRPKPKLETQNFQTFRCSCESPLLNWDLVGRACS